MVTLRPIDLSDAGAIAAAVGQSRDALRRWMAWYRDDYHEQTAEAWLAASLDGASRGTAQHFAVLDDCGTLIGVIGIEDFNEESGRAMIGYWLATPASGRQNGRKAIAQLLAWARMRSALHALGGCRRREHCESSCPGD